MIPFFGLIVLGLLACAYFTRGMTRIMLVLMAIAIIQLKSVYIGMKLFSLTVIAIGIIYFLRPKKK